MSDFFASAESQHPRKVNKIAMLGTFPPLRGLSSYCLAISHALANLVQVEFISFQSLYPSFLYPGGGLAEDHSFPAAIHHNLTIKRRLTWYNPVTWLREAIFTNADVLHAQWWSLPLAAVYMCICYIFKLRGKPVIFTVHNVLSHERSRTYAAVSRLLFKLGDHFIVHSERNRQQMMACFKIPPERTSLIAHGSLDFHVRNQTDHHKIRSELDIDANMKVILLFGAIRPYKGLDTALTAFAEVRRDISEALLLIAGKLWQKWEPHRQLIEELEIADAVRTHLDYVPSGEVYKYFEVADLVILPYDQFDSQSGVGSTAVSFHKPMIVTAVGGLPDLIKDNQWVVPPKNPAALARAIIRCLKNPVQLAAMAADTKAVAESLSWPPIAKKTCAIYDQLIGVRHKKSIVEKAKLI
jgi:glycosyltransferase involved in cell wall biosynthesis